MSITKFTMGLSAMGLSALGLSALAILLVAAPAFAQREIRHIPPMIDPDGFNPDLTHPFLEPSVFSPDYQLFAPADFSEFGSGTPASKGWFASYDRVYLWVTRPDNQTAVTGVNETILVQPQILADGKNGDFTWGNRFDVGYMTAEDHGWLASFFHLGGPNINDVTTVERIDVFNAVDQINGNPQNTVNLRGGMGGMMGGMNLGLQGQPRRDQNDPVTGARDYHVTKSINDASISTFEFNKTFRLRPLHYGSIIEPFFGFRFMKFSDHYRRDTYERFSAAAAPLGPGIPVAPTTILLFPTEDYTVQQATFDNNMVGGQLGLRWFKRKEKWNLAGEVRAFAFQNFQSLQNQTDLERTFYNGVGVGSMINSVVYDSTNNAAHSTEFVFGTEIRAEAAYSVTRDISIRVGMQLMEMARGIGRGNSILQNDQSVTIVGGTFGFVVNR